MPSRPSSLPGPLEVLAAPVLVLSLLFPVVVVATLATFLYLLVLLLLP